MPATVTPFPRARHRPFVQKHAQRMASLSRSAAEQHLVNQLGILAATMSKRGIDQATITAELCAVTSAIRAELWHAVITPGGAA